MRSVLRRVEPAERDVLRALVGTLGYEIIPFKGAESAVLAHVPRDIRLTVTASPTKGQDATIDLAVRLAGHGYEVAPHLSAQQVRDRQHLGEVVEHCRKAGISSVFVIGGDPTATRTEFRHAYDLLVSLPEVGHEFTDIGIAGHPEGHPAVSDEDLFKALADKTPLATHITTQMVFAPQTILSWALELRRRGNDLPIRVGMPGAVHREKLLRVIAGLGIGESAKSLRKQKNLAWRFFVPGGYNPSGIISGLVPALGHSENNIAGFHVFTFNDLAATEAWRNRLIDSLG